jgi:CRP-like cAMP-binding protein
MRSVVQIRQGSGHVCPAKSPYPKRNKIAVVALNKIFPRTADDAHEYLVAFSRAVTMKFRPGDLIFSQGDPAASLYYINRGRVKLTVTAANGREAIVAILDDHSFFGEGSLLADPVRLATATAMTSCTIDRISSTEMLNALHADIHFAELFTNHLLTRNSRVEADLVDHLLNSSEKRLARALLLLANYGVKGNPEPITTKISQETLAEMIGTTRSRVSSFMNKFRKLDLIDYDAGHITVHNSLLDILLQD